MKNLMSGDKDVDLIILNKLKQEDLFKNFIN